MDIAIQRYHAYVQCEQPRRGRSNDPYSTSRKDAGSGDGVRIIKHVINVM